VTRKQIREILRINQKDNKNTECIDSREKCSVGSNILFKGQKTEKFDDK
jgi:hypothetical protein